MRNAIWLGCLLLVCAFRGQAQEATWDKDAGGKMSFEAASVREDQGPFRSSSFALTADNSFRDPNGRFHADAGLDTYIAFAYKLWLAPDQRNAMRAAIPEAMRSTRYLIEATAPLSATKDQYRLMVRALLQERFGLKVHEEQHEVPVLEMTLLRPGRPGPKLIPHSQGTPCDAELKVTDWPKECASFAMRPKAEIFQLGGVLIAGARGVTMAQVANFLSSQAGPSSGISRPVVDRTGLAGAWDFTLEAVSAMPDPQAESSSSGPTMLQALPEQLGIRLKPGRGMIWMLVVDHIEPLREN